MGGFDLAKNGAIVARVETGNRAPELHVFSGGRERALTRLNADFHARVTLGEKVSVSFKAPDGTEVQAFVTKPPGFVPGRRYPTVLHIHGGPVGQFGWGFDFKPQYLAAQRLPGRGTEPARVDGPRRGFHPRHLPHLGHHGLRRRDCRGRPRDRAGLGRSGTARGHGLFLRRLPDERRHHANGPLQGRGLRRGPQLHRGQLRS